MNSFLQKTFFTSAIVTVLTMSNVALALSNNSVNAKINCNVYFQKVSKLDKKLSPNVQKTNKIIRQWYLNQNRSIGILLSLWKKEGVSREQMAYRTWAMRRENRIKARGMMINKQQVKLLQQRDLCKYNNANGPTFTWLLQHVKKRKTHSVNAYNSIVTTAQETNK